MTKRLQYPNKPDLIKKASKKIESPTYALCGFRTFNTKNPPSKQIFAIANRLAKWYGDRKPRVIVLCYLHKSRKLKIEDTVLEQVRRRFPHLNLLCEHEL